MGMTMHTRVPYPALCLLVSILVVGNGFAYVTLLRPAEVSRLTVSFLDVGQGDSILIEGPTGIEVLVDGGKDRQVLRELPRLMGPLDRSLDAMIATHPDADHI